MLRGLLLMLFEGKARVGELLINTSKAKRDLEGRVAQLEAVIEHKSNLLQDMGRQLRETRECLREEQIRRRAAEAFIDARAIRQ